MSLFSGIKRWWNNLFSKEDIEQALGVTLAVSGEMQQIQNLWRQMIQGKAPWNNDKVKSLMLTGSICTEVARPVTMKSESEITGSARAKWLNEQHQMVFDNLRKTTELLCANGKIILKPVINDDQIITHTFENNMFYPIGYDEKDNLIDIVFQYNLAKEKKFYTLLERCTFEGNNYTISYTAWISDDETKLGRSIELNKIDEWAKLPEAITFANVEQPWFVEIKMPSLNHIVQNSPEGMAIFSKAVDLIEKSDLHEELTEHEFKAGRLKQNVSSDMLRKDAKGEYVVDKDVFNVFETNGEKEYINTYNPDFRQDPLQARENKLKRDIEFVCGISYGTISDPSIIEKTAKEVMAGKQRFHITVSDIQKVLEEALIKLAAIMDDIATRYYLAPQGKYDISFWWSDNILISDEERMTLYDAELNRMIKLQSIGAIGVEEIRAFVTENSDYFSKLTDEMISKARLELPDMFNSE